MLNFDCNKCMHQKVCAYIDTYPTYQDPDKDSVFEVKVHCKEYKEKLTIPKISGDSIVVPYERTWPSTTSEITLLHKETECMAYRTYIERAKDTNYVGDSPCSYCLKTSCPRSQLITCSNESNQGGEIK